MSNCYVTFYFEVPLEGGVADEVCKFLCQADRYHGVDGDEQEKICVALSPVFSDFREYQELGFQWQITKNVLCIDADESGNTEHASELLKWLLPKVDAKALGFTYAAFGDGANDGGAVCVSSDGCEWMNAETWLAEKVA